MIAPDVSHDITHASIYFHELFKKTLLADTMPGATTKTQMDVLVTLTLNGPMSMSDLSKRVGIAPEQATRTIRSLREAGLAESERSATNRRVVMARISKQGEQVMEDHQRQVTANLSAVLDGLTDEEVSQLAELSRQASAILRKTGFRHIVPE